MAGLTQTLVAELDLSKNKISVCLELACGEAGPFLTFITNMFLSVSICGLCLPERQDVALPAMDAQCIVGLLPSHKKPPATPEH